MKTYTKKQLVKAQYKYNKEYLKNPKDFNEVVSGTKKGAKGQIEYLLSLVEE